MKKLLIVEDDLLLDEAYKKKFEGKYDVKIVDNGEDGVNEAKNWQPDVALLDVYMPGKFNGLDVLKQIRSDASTNALPVLVITNLPDVVSKVLEMGANKCMMKTDVDLNSIEQEIESLLM